MNYLASTGSRTKTRETGRHVPPYEFFMVFILLERGGLCATVHLQLSDVGPHKYRKEDTVGVNEAVCC